MSEYPIFPNAPITEALLDIRVELPEGFDIKKLEAFHNSIKDRFPEKQERLSFRGGFQFSPEGLVPLPASTKPDGYLFRSSTEKKVVQARLDGFTFNKLKPYERWELFCSEARELWNLYFQLTKPVKVIRIALRYINRIEIPLQANITEYILNSPMIADKLQGMMDHFFMRLVVKNPDLEATAVITETMENPTTSDKLPLIFDIDVWKETIFEDNDAKIWDEFEKLCSFKNEIFFNSITDKTKELFK